MSGSETHLTAPSLWNWIAPKNMAGFTMCAQTGECALQYWPTTSFEVCSCKMHVCQCKWVNFVPDKQTHSRWKAGLSNLNFTVFWRVFCLSFFKPSIWEYILFETCLKLLQEDKRKQHPCKYVCLLYGSNWTSKSTKQHCVPFKSFLNKTINVIKSQCFFSFEILKFFTFRRRWAPSWQGQARRARRWQGLVSWEEKIRQKTDKKSSRPWWGSVSWQEKEQQA